MDGDGCRTRDEVLPATVDRTRPYQVQRHGRYRADMVAGTWTDLYTGQTMTWTNLKDITQAESLPLDHIVSLAGRTVTERRTGPSSDASNSPMTSST